MMMAMIITVSNVVIVQYIKHGAQTRKSVQQKDVTSQTMLVNYANAATTNY
jgi:hypothetical protein